MDLRPPCDRQMSLASQHLCMNTLLRQKTKSEQSMWPCFHKTMIEWLGLRRSNHESRLKWWCLLHLSKWAELYLTCPSGWSLLSSGKKSVCAFLVPSTSSFTYPVQNKKGCASGRVNQTFTSFSGFQPLLQAYYYPIFYTIESCATKFGG